MVCMFSSPRRHEGIQASLVCILLISALSGLTTALAIVHLLTSLPVIADVPATSVSRSKPRLVLVVQVCSTTIVPH